MRTLRLAVTGVGLAVALGSMVAARRAPDIHAEWVKFVGAGGDTVRAYLAYPERPDPAPAMIVIHEIFGMSDWIKSVTEDFARRGYVAVAPVLGVYAENDARITASVPDVDQAMRAAGKTYLHVVYPGTGHGFLRTRDVAAQADKAWGDIFTFLGEKLGK